PSSAPHTPLSNVLTMDEDQGQRRLRGLHDLKFVSPPSRDIASPEAERSVDSDSGFEEPANEGESAAGGDPEDRALTETPDDNADGDWEGFVDKGAEKEGRMAKEFSPKKPMEGEGKGEGALLQPGDWQGPLEPGAPAPTQTREEPVESIEPWQIQVLGQRLDPRQHQEPGQNEDPGEGSESASSHPSIPEFDWDVMGCSHGQAEGQVYSYNIHLLNTKCAGHHMFFGGLYNTAEEANRAMERDVLARYGGSGNQELLGWCYHKGECLRMLARTPFDKHVSAAVWECEKSPEPEFGNEYEMGNEGGDHDGDGASKEGNQEDRDNQKDEEANDRDENDRGEGKEVNKGKAEKKRGEAKEEESNRECLFEFGREIWLTKQTQHDPAVTKGSATSLTTLGRSNVRS
ncbi:MAG: hypothetical protein Q9183_005524, partial [Haloplaca sp. 2 TL-2023]